MKPTPKVESLRKLYTPIYEQSIKQYENMIVYWSSPLRVVCSSNRLNQSREFIDGMIFHCNNQLNYFKLQLAKL